LLNTLRGLLYQRDSPRHGRFAGVPRAHHGVIHPFWLKPNLGTPGYTDFQSIISGITGMGYTWADASTVQ